MVVCEDTIQAEVGPATLHQLSTQLQLSISVPRGAKKAMIWLQSNALLAGAMLKSNEIPISDFGPSELTPEQINLAFGRTVFLELQKGEHDAWPNGDKPLVLILFIQRDTSRKGATWEAYSEEAILDVRYASQGVQINKSEFVLNNQGGRVYASDFQQNERFATPDPDKEFDRRESIKLLSVRLRRKPELDNLQLRKLSRPVAGSIDKNGCKAKSNWRGLMGNACAAMCRTVFVHGFVAPSLALVFAIVATSYFGVRYFVDRPSEPQTPTQPQPPTQAQTQPQPPIDWNRKSIYRQLFDKVRRLDSDGNNWLCPKSSTFSRQSGKDAYSIDNTLFIRCRTPKKDISAFEFDAYLEGLFQDAARDMLEGNGQQGDDLPQINVFTIFQ